MLPLLAMGYGLLSKKSHSNFLHENCAKIFLRVKIARNFDTISHRGEKAISHKFWRKFWFLRFSLFPAISLFISSYFVKFREPILGNEWINHEWLMFSEFYTIWSSRWPKIGNKQADTQTREIYTYLSIITKSHQ